MPTLLKPMREFDPLLPALVHDKQNDRAFFWPPKWASSYRRSARENADGAVEFDGLLLDGWLEPEQGPPS
jgi:hypothetical protein